MHKNTHSTSRAHVISSSRLSPRFSTGEEPGYEATLVVYETDHLPCVRTQSNVLQLLCENETAIFLPTVFFQVFILVV